MKSGNGIMYVHPYLFIIPFFLLLVGSKDLVVCWLPDLPTYLPGYLPAFTFAYPGLMLSILLHEAQQYVNYKDYLSKITNKISCQLLTFIVILKIYLILFFCEIPVNLKCIKTVKN